MPSPNSTSLISIKDWTLRIRKSEHPHPRLLLLIHGFTGDENSMWVFSQNLPQQYWMVAPRAPYEAVAEEGGYSWRPPQFENLNQLGLDSLRSSAEALIDLVDAYAASVGLDASEFDVMGFSQGAGICGVLAFLYPERIGKVGILAGFVPDGLEQLVSQRPLNEKALFVAHGTKDEKVPLERAQASVEMLQRAGAKVTYCEDEVGHKLSLTCLRALRDFLAN